MSNRGGYYGNQQQQQQQQNPGGFGTFKGIGSNLKFGSNQFGGYNGNSNQFGGAAVTPSGFNVDGGGAHGNPYGAPQPPGFGVNPGSAGATNYGGNSGGNSYHYGGGGYHNQPPPPPGQQQPPPPPFGGYQNPYEGSGNSYGGIPTPTEEVFGGGNRDLYDDAYGANANNQGNLLYGLRPASSSGTTADPFDPGQHRGPVNAIPFPPGYPLYNPDNLRQTPYPYDSLGGGVTSRATTVVTTSSSSSTNGYVKFGSQDDDFMPGGGTTMGVLAVVSILCVLIFVFGLIALLKKRNRDPRDDVLYGAAAAAGGADVRYAPGGTGRQFSAMSRDVSCLNCKLIEMGSMACYQELCPQCGRPPPNR